MTALGVAERTDDEAERIQMYDEAIEAFRSILVNRPELVRVRLELARTFFLKGRDSLARRHFELVLAGGPPTPVALNILQFLDVIRARKRWSGYFGAAIAPDSNLNAASESEIIYLDTVFGRLPLRREGDFGARSGFGLSLWGGGEYQRPLGERLRLRVGSDLSVREYPGGDFDQTFVAAHAGPRCWRVRSPTSACWPPRSGSGWGAGRTSTRAACAWRSTACWGAFFWCALPRHCGNATASSTATGAMARSTTTPSAWRGPRRQCLRIHFTVGYTRDHAESEPWRTLSRWTRVGTSLALPLGFTWASAPR